jgi:hypothetical protein
MTYEIDTETGDVRTKIVPCTNSGYHWPNLAYAIVKNDSDPTIEGHQIRFVDKEGVIVAKFCVTTEPGVNHVTITQLIEDIQFWFSNRMSQLETLIHNLDIIKEAKELSKQNE